MVRDGFHAGSLAETEKRAHGVAPAKIFIANRVVSG